MEGSENVNRPNGVKGAKVIQVIETKAMRGTWNRKRPSKSCNSVLGLRWEFLSGNGP